MVKHVYEIEEVNLSEEEENNFLCWNDQEKENLKKINEKIRSFQNKFFVGGNIEFEYIPQNKNGDILLNDLGFFRQKENYKRYMGYENINIHYGLFLNELYGKIYISQYNKVSRIEESDYIFSMDQKKKRILERINDLVENDILHFDEYFDYNLNKNTKRYMITNTAYSDYSGSSIEKANSEFLKRKWKTDFPFIMEETYHYSGSKLYFEVNDENLLHENFGEFLDLLEGLYNYPLFDDMILSEIESEIEIEYYENNIKDQIQNKYFELTGEELNEDQTYELFEKIKEGENLYFSHEMGLTCYIDIDRILDNMQDYILTNEKGEQIMQENILIWESKNKRYSIYKNKEGKYYIEYENGFLTQYPCIYMNKNELIVTYDFPESFPKYVLNKLKLLAKKDFSLK